MKKNELGVTSKRYKYIYFFSMYAGGLRTQNAMRSETTFFAYFH